MALPRWSRKIRILQDAMRVTSVISTVEWHPYLVEIVTAVESVARDIIFSVSKSSRTQIGFDFYSFLYGFNLFRGKVFHQEASTA